MIAKDYAEFMSIMTSLVREALNAPEQQEHIRLQHEIERKRNPNLTDEEWKAIKQNMFLQSVKDAINTDPTLQKECLYHLKNYMEVKSQKN